MMRIRKMDADGDMQFGRGAADFHHDRPEGVGQSVLTRLHLAEGEWFLDLADGTPYSTEILGVRTEATYDLAIQDRILGTPGVTEIVSYSSALDRDKRALGVTAEINTAYGTTTVSTVAQ